MVSMAPTLTTTLHDVVNNGSIDAHLVVTYVIAKGVNKRADQSAPACPAVCWVFFESAATVRASATTRISY
jgi:hypothetical protein